MPSENIQTCYMCEHIATSVEHVPPRCLFPRGHRNNLITVPSCDIHNTGGQKTMDDEYLRDLIAFNFTSDVNEDSEINIKTLKSYQRNDRKISIFQDPRNLLLNGEPTGAFTVDHQRVFNIFTTITRGLYFHDTSEKYLADITVNLYFLTEPDNGYRLVKDNPLTLYKECKEFFSQFPQLGQNPEIFSYRQGLDNGKIVGYWMTFYNGSEVLTTLDNNQID